MQITRSVLDTGPGSAGWFTGSVSIDPVAAPTGAFPVGDAAVHPPGQARVTHVTEEQHGHAPSIREGAH